MRKALSARTKANSFHKPLPFLKHPAQSGPSVLSCRAAAYRSPVRADTKPRMTPVFALAQQLVHLRVAQRFAAPRKRRPKLAVLAEAGAAPGSATAQAWYPAGTPGTESGRGRWRLVGLLAAARTSSGWWRALSCTAASNFWPWPSAKPLLTGVRPFVSSSPTCLSVSFLPPYFQRQPKLAARPKARAAEGRFAAQHVAGLALRAGAQA